jgi:two-component system chemotaxis response regulator CheY
MAKIMIVDDSAYARRVHRAMLERAGHSIVEASTGMGAIESFSLERPDIVVLDLSMDDIGGVEVLRTLRELDADACVVVVSADVQRSTAASVLAGGAQRFLAKPANEDELVATIAELTRDAAT